MLQALELCLHRRLGAHARTEDRFFPARLVQHMKDTGVRGRVFNHYDWGAYLFFNFDQDIKVFIDQRTNILYDVNFAAADTGKNFIGGAEVSGADSDGALIDSVKQAGFNNVSIVTQPLEQNGSKR